MTCSSKLPNKTTIKEEFSVSNESPNSISLFGESMVESPWISINDKSFSGPQFGIYIGPDRNFYLFDMAHNSPLKIKLLSKQAFFLYPKQLVELGFESKSQACEYYVEDIYDCSKDVEKHHSMSEGDHTVYRTHQGTI